MESLNLKTALSLHLKEYKMIYFIIITMFPFFSF